MRYQNFSIGDGNHAPQRLVVAGVGVDHADLVSAVERHFQSGSSAWEENPNLLLVTYPVRWGEHVSALSLRGPSLAGRRRRFGAYAAIAGRQAFACPRHAQYSAFLCRDPDLIAFCTPMQLGGESSFSSGGPGKGMYSRLYTEVMNRCHWIYGATSYNHSYADAGLFCVHASSDPERINDVLTVTWISSSVCPKVLEKRNRSGQKSS
ncbi:hypothetical protein KIN20_032603 [Parelaphostrongylus tenuis]|uniref:Peptidase M16 C-terminal domain-containing protein n=1 Tax=Parelaphostrongylus tenuis TaxID=148309 RepID=A0AAD5R7E0_PARTN|nr:hypothetical protein KIN20_032603 [Parelaphostrongylus tenuis]